MDKIGLNFETTFRITTLSLRINRSHPALLRNRAWKMQYCFILVFNFICICLLSNSILNHDIKDGRFADTSKNLVMIIVSITINLKFAIINYRKESMLELIEVVNNDYELTKGFTEEEKEIVNRYAKKGAKVSKLWLAVAILTGLLFPLRPIVLMILSYIDGKFKLEPMFDLSFPYFLNVYKDTLPFFLSWFLICLMFDFYSATMYVGFDPVVPILMLHNCGQLEILSTRMLKLFSEEKSNKHIEENLIHIAIKLQEIYRTINCINKYFTILYEYMMKTTTFLIPLSAFQVTESLRHNDLNLEFLNFGFGAIMHFYMPCYYSDLLMEKSQELRQAIYACNWENNRNMRVRKIVLFMLTRTTRPLVISTVFFPICLDTFAEMSRQAYAIFNIMNAAWG